MAPANAEQLARYGIAHLEAGVDWLTWVAPGGRDGREVESVARGLLDDQRRATGRSQTFSAHGYHGEQCHGVAWGVRPDGHYLRLSGTLAASRWALLVSCAGHPTRLDSQVTCSFTSPQTRFGQRSMRTLSRSSGRRLGRPVKRTLWQDTAGAYCGLVGARTSPKYGRVYDKGVEQGDAPAGTRWRVEVELKAERAQEAWNCLTKATDPAAWCYGACAAAWESWRLSWCLPSADSVHVFAPVEPKMPLPVAASLKWLETQVSPTLQRLLPVVGTETLLRALGMDGYAEPIGRASD